ncbi:Sip2p LALA0_S06e07206g [Lachancea lanzarotensis]|uniref:LALA0S06e07206g1_1 n=1 Tax=Lachancea lanzarotensis TaxID=1245769 RepID=A0A0C7MYV4_9SACH|nr:uncharacterized protein LALA0_S06e07206g [Lachancea lanzarotensis]CEP62931.1 LALA0S06e07206g1_1 [Lachancea lanzarotensis]
MGNTHSRGTMSDNIKDVSMVDVSSADESNKRGSQRAIVQSFSKLDIGDHSESQPPLLRRRSTLIFDDEDEIPRHEENVGHRSELDVSENPLSGSSSSASVHDNRLPQRGSDVVFQQQQRQGSDDSAFQQHHLQQQLQQHQQSPDPNSVLSPQQTSPSVSRNGSEPPAESPKTMVPVEITWQQGGSKIYVTGSFTGWRKMIGLVPVSGQPGLFHIKLQLPPGTHRFRFIVDNELRFSDYMPTATDQMGNFVNYLEIASPAESQDQLQHPQLQEDLRDGEIQPSPLVPGKQQHHQASPLPLTTADQKLNENRTAPEPLSARSKLALQIEEEPDDMGDGYSRFHGAHETSPLYSYITDIPAVFTDSSVMEQYYLTLDQQQSNQQSMAWLTPPQLPPHLENVILNNYSSASEPGDSGSENNSGALPIPNHVVLNHLATSSIKHNTLCVASIVRYKRKYATQMLYSPLQ